MVGGPVRTPCAPRDREEGVGCFKCGFGVGQELFADGGDDDFACGAFDKLHAKAGFEGDEGLRE